MQRIAIRTLKKNARYSWTVIATLALGIGVSTAAFSIVHHVLLAPLPYGEPEELVVVWGDYSRIAGSPRGSLSRETLRELEAMTSLVDVEAQFSYYANVGSDRLDQVVMASRVTPGFLDGLGVAPLLGRTLRDGDRDGVVLSYGLWQSYFGGRSDVLGQSFRLEDLNPLRDPAIGSGAELVTVVGVMPRGFWAPAFFSNARRQTDVWIPFLGAEAVANERTTFLHVYGRLMPGGSIDRVRGELGRVVDRLAEGDPEGWVDVTLRTEPLVENHLGGARTRILLLGGAGFTLLVIVLMNTGSLALGRAMTRGPEYAVRTALGASRSQMVWSSVAENAVLLSVTAVAALLIARGLVSAFAAFAPTDIPRLDTLEVTGGALGAALVTSAMSMFVLSVSVLVVRGDGEVAGGIRRGGGRRAVRLQNAAVAGQVALTVLILVSMTLAVRGLRNMMTVDPVTGVESRLTFRIGLPQPRYPTATDKVRVMTELHRAISAVPGVRATGSADQIPPVQGGGGGPLVSDLVSEPLLVGIRTVTRGYLDALELPVLEGRAFEASDGMASDRVALVNETTARTLWPGVSPVGGVIRSQNGAFLTTVVGVVPDLPSLLVGEPLRPEVYVLHEQQPWGQHWAVVRVAGDPMDFVDPVRAAVRSVDPDLPVSEIATLSGRFAGAAETPRFLGGTLSLLTVAALFLAVVGTVAVLTQVVAYRFREMAIRLAVGASPRRVTRLLLQEGLVVAGLGALLGAGAAVPAGAALTSQLYGVDGADVPTVLTAVGVVLLVTLGATLPLLTRAGRMDPSRALRSE